MTHSYRKIQPQVLDFKPYTAGLSIEEIAVRYKLSRVIKLSSNENPLGMSRVVQEALQKVVSYGFRYPRAGSPELTRALADFYALPQEHFLVCNGSDEAIDLLIRVLVRPGQDQILVCDPCFSMYTLQAQLCGVGVQKVALNRDFSIPCDRLLSAVDEHTGLIFLTSPDNPSGSATSKQQILNLARKLPRDCFLILDEAYLEFADQPDQLSPLAELGQMPNLILLRTFSKLYGLAGLRVGYAIMPPWIREYCLRVKSPFSVNILAEQAGIAALKDQAFARLTWSTVQEGRNFLFRELERLGCRVFPSQANFVMFQPPIPAAKLFEGLLEQGIIIRPLSSYGLEEHLRVSIGTRSENEAFLETTERILGRKTA